MPFKSRTGAKRLLVEKNIIKQLHMIRKYVKSLKSKPDTELLKHVVVVPIPILKKEEKLRDWLRKVRKSIEIN